MHATFNLQQIMKLLPQELGISITSNKKGCTNLNCSNLEEGHDSQG